RQSTDVDSVFDDAHEGVGPSRAYAPPAARAAPFQVARGHSMIREMVAWVSAELTAGQQVLAIASNAITMPGIESSYHRPR
ncbi:MAG: hypothetical protein LC667_07560, partial [Thioalkalivibrio sp.]|nr:hypothetical protein [Thioalkalivibrio sp.]